MKKLLDDFAYLSEKYPWFPLAVVVVFFMSLATTLSVVEILIN